MRPVYYNEIDPFAVQWLKNLIAAGYLPAGDVDDRDIWDVCPDDLTSYTQCHFFAGLGGWPYALRLAGWPDDRPVWTGSCPCQPFSAAGKGEGQSDPRHLWPQFSRLIRECRPVTVFGEQVEAAIRHGWLDLVQDDLERAGYAIGAVGLPAASVGAPHIRQRLWFVADRDGSRCGTWRTRQASDGRDATRIKPAGPCDVGVAQGDANNPRSRSQGRQFHAERAGERAAGASGVAGELADTDESQSGNGGLQRSGRLLQPAEDAAPRESVEHAESEQVGISRRARQPRESFWSSCDWLPCRDGKARPVESGTFPLAHGVPARVGRLRGYGNAIVPQVAAAFICTYLDAFVGR